MFLYKWLCRLFKLLSCVQRMLVHREAIVITDPSVTAFFSLLPPVILNYFFFEKKIKSVGDFI